MYKQVDPQVAEVTQVLPWLRKAGIYRVRIYKCKEKNACKLTPSHLSYNYTRKKRSRSVIHTGTVRWSSAIETVASMDELFHPPRKQAKHIN